MNDAVRTIRDAIAADDIPADELTARGLGARLGRTTSVLYHHWGSLDGFLFAVAQDGYLLLADRLGAVADAGLPDLAEAFVAFGLEHKVLYGLMFERTWDWGALRATGAMADLPGLALWAQSTERLAGAGSDDPAGDALLLQAVLHGLVSLANSGRANVGDLTVSDRDAAIRAARTFARRISAKEPIR